LCKATKAGSFSFTGFISSTGMTTALRNPSVVVY
jgi:hypothetical protein